MTYRKPTLTRPPYQRATTASAVSPCSILIKSHGFSLLELLISVAIFTIGFLALLSLQQVSFKLTRDAALQSTVMTLSDSLAEQLKVNDLDSVKPGWQALVRNSLPEGKGSVFEQGSEIRLNLEWLESEHSGDASNTPSYDMIFRHSRPPRMPD